MKKILLLFSSFIFASTLNAFVPPKSYFYRRDLNRFLQGSVHRTLQREIRRVERSPGPNNTQLNIALLNLENYYRLLGNDRHARAVRRYPNLVEKLQREANAIAARRRRLFS